MRSNRIRFLPHLRGHGLEVGALHEPTRLPEGATACYADVLTVEMARTLFPELGDIPMVTPQHIVDLDADWFSDFASESFDFVILSHVLEHLANPLRVLEDLFRVVRPGGVALLAVPDMRFTFDRNRSVTLFRHLWNDYLAGVRESSDEHYIDFLRGVAPEILRGSEQDIAHHVSRVRSRREHVHTWTSETFREMLVKCSRVWGLEIDAVAESYASENREEYCGIWRKSRSP